MHDLDHKTMITQYKANWNKFWNKIPNQYNVEGWNCKK
jgi:hypothetical protein